MTGTDPVARDIPGVIAPPPLIYLGGLLTGALLERVWPTGGFGLAPDLRWPLAAGFTLFGVSLLFFAARAFNAAQTNLSPYKPSTAVVSSGPYGLSRNPIYLGFTLIYIGLALALDAPLALAMVVVVLPLMQWGVIAREERYLAAKMGAPYAAYCTRVRRWI